MSSFTPTKKGGGGRISFIHAEGGVVTTSFEVVLTMEPEKSFTLSCGERGAGGGGGGAVPK